MGRRKMSSVLCLARGRVRVRVRVRGRGRGRGRVTRLGRVEDVLDAVGVGAAQGGGGGLAG